MYLAKVNKLNFAFEQNNYNGIVLKPVTSFKKKKNILFVSVHSVNHYNGVKESNLKFADLNTGGLVKFISNCTNASYIINNTRTNEINPYKGVTNADKFIRKFRLIFANTTIFDIHGAKNNNFFDIAIGTSTYPNENQRKIISIIKLIAMKYRLKLKLNLYNYKAANNRTITKRALNIGIKSAIQIEITKEFRTTEKIQKTINFLNELHRRIIIGN